MRKLPGCRTIIGMVVLVVVVVFAVILSGGNKSEVQSTPMIEADSTVVPGSDEDRFQMAATMAVPLRAAFMKIDGIQSVNMGIVPSKAGVNSAVGGDATIAAGSDMPTIATAMRDASYKVLGTASLEFSVILNDGKQAISYDWDNATDTWKTTEITQGK